MISLSIHHHSQSFKPSLETTLFFYIYHKTNINSIKDNSKQRMKKKRKREKQQPAKTNRTHSRTSIFCKRWFYKIPSNTWVKGDILYYPAGINNCHSPTWVTLKTLESKFPLSNVVFNFGGFFAFFSSLLVQFNPTHPMQWMSEKTLSQITIKNYLPL